LSVISYARTCPKDLGTQVKSAIISPGSFLVQYIFHEVPLFHGVPSAIFYQFMEKATRSEQNFGLRSHAIGIV
jgi:hypothetical protein